MGPPALTAVSRRDAPTPRGRRPPVVPARRPWAAPWAGRAGGPKGRARGPGRSSPPGSPAGRRGCRPARRRPGCETSTVSGFRLTVRDEDQRLQQVVLELLVDHEEDRHHDQRRDRVDERRDQATSAPRVAPTSGIRSAIATNSAISPANGTPIDLQRDVRQDAADHADQQVAGDVAGDRLGAVRRRRAAPGLGAPPVEQGQGAVDDLRGLEHHQVRQHEDGHHAGDAGGDAAQHAGGRRGQPAARTAGSASWCCCTYCRALVRSSRLPIGAAARLGVVDELGQLAGERRALLREWHGERRDQAAEREQHDEEDEQRRRASRGAPVTRRCDPVDQRRQRDREERGDDDPGQDPA